MHTVIIVKIKLSPSLCSPHDLLDWDELKEESRLYMSWLICSNFVSFIFDVLVCTGVAIKDIADSVCS